MHFTKMHGAGNDYIYVDCFAEAVPRDIPALARRMSERRLGVGADGLILICPSNRADAEMRMFNADGSPAEMCGNGIRCVAKYLYDHGIRRRETLEIESAGRIFALELKIARGVVDRVRVDMGQPILIPEQIPTKLRASSAPEQPVVELPVAVGGRELRVTCVSMGNPHCVAFVDQLGDELVLGIGPQLEVASQFPNRTNVEFAKVLSGRELEQRTWERGSGETLACGTGACAVCVAGVLTGRTGREVQIHLRGGDLEIEWREADNHVYMTGPAIEVFSGDWRVN
ncbi:MAG TPA: diaminopimelate epimerase [Lacipirellulaceae bacterium]|nr:diaminopimelate epimerase [Lacipirellulaceae bacterium]